GLTAAIALRRMNIEVALYEQASAIGEIGAGITLSPNAMKAYRALGIEDQIADVGFEPEHHVMRSWDTGAEISRVLRRGVYQQEYGAKYYSMHRADLVDVLSRNLQGAAVTLGARCV